MKALIWKDICAMGRALKIYTLFLCGYLILALLGLFDLKVAAAMLHVVILMLPLGAFAHEPEGVENMPRANQRAEVGARYLLVLLSALTSGVIGLFGSTFLSVIGAENRAEYVCVVLISLGAGLLVAEFMLPFYCKFGVKRARPYLYAVIVLPMLALFGQFRLENLESGVFGWMAGAAQRRENLLLFLLVGIAGLGLSYLISCRLVLGKAHT